MMDTTASPRGGDSAPSESPATHCGALPAWGVADLPEPLPLTFRNALKTIGPGAILLAGSIGGGEWLVGPAVAVQHGTGVFWIATIAIVLQLLLNLEGIRYTLYTGEPVLTGIMRLKPGSGFWGTTYIVLTIAQLGVPALAAGCAAVLFAGFTGAMAQEMDAPVLVNITYGVILFVAMILLFGGTIERTLEIASWGMIVYIFVFLTTVNVLFVPASHWVKTASGFLQFGHIPREVDLLLLAALAATAGSGGIGNLAISNLVRDKGMGMGATVGAIGSAFGSKGVQLSHIGKVFPMTAENMRRWRLWWTYVGLDQIVLWAGGCFVGMFLNINLATAIMPAGTQIDGLGAGAYQASYMAEHLWKGFWFLGLLNGFWILLSTHMNNTDGLVRTVTDILWVSSARIRTRPGGAVNRIYYGLLLLFTVWGMIAVNWGSAMTLFKMLALIAGLVLAVAAVQVLRVNTTLLPPELRPTWWRRVAIVICALFYGTFCGLVMHAELQKTLHPSARPPVVDAAPKE